MKNLFLACALILAAQPSFAELDDAYRDLTAWLAENPEDANGLAQDVQTHSCSCVSRHKESLDVSWGSDFCECWTCTGGGGPPIGCILCLGGSVLSCGLYPLVMGILNLFPASAQGIAHAANHKVQPTQRQSFASERNVLRYQAEILKEAIERQREFRGYVSHEPDLQALFNEWSAIAGVARDPNLVPNRATLTSRLNAALAKYPPLKEEARNRVMRVLNLPATVAEPLQME